MTTKREHDVYTGLTSRGTILWKCRCGAEGTVKDVAEIPAPHSIPEKRAAA